MEDLSMNISRLTPEAVFPAVITADGEFMLPGECLTGDINMGEGADPFVLTNSLDKDILSLYTRAAFEEVCNQINGLDMVVPNKRVIERRIIGEAAEVFIDENRCIKINPEWLLKMGFDTEQVSGGLKDFPVMILKFKTKLAITSVPVYEKLMKDIQGG